MQSQPSRSRRWLSVAADLASICTAILLVFLTGVLVVSAAVRGASLARPQPAQQAGTRPPQQPVTVLDAMSTVGLNAIRGESAKLALIEFADYQCKFCGIYNREILPVLKQEFIDTGEVSYVYRDFPSETRGTDPIRASVAADCARQQGQYWQMHDQLYQSQGKRDDAALIASAENVALRVPAFKVCLSVADLTRIRGDQAEGRRLGVSATPTFFVGLVLPDGSVAIKRQIRGAQPIEVFRSTLRDVRREAGFE